MAEQNPQNQNPQDRPKKNGSRLPSPGGGMRFGRGLFGWVLFIGLVVMLFMLLNQNRNRSTEIPLSNFFTALDGGKVQTLTIEGDEISGKLKGNGEPIGPAGQMVTDFRTVVPTLEDVFLKLTGHSIRD